MSDNLIEYPASPVSVEALEFIGLKRDVAERIFENLKSAQIEEELEEEDLAYELPSFLRGHLNQLHSKYDELPIRDAFTRIGLTPDTIAAILDPECQDIFETNTPFYWAYDTLRMRFNHLLLVDERTKNTQSQSSSSQTHATSGTTYSGITNSHLPTTCTFVESAPTPPEDHLVLYIGKCPAGFRFLRDTAFIQEDGSIDMTSIGSQPGGDFNATASAWYFTTEHETADKYRAYAARRCENEETWIIWIAIPRQLAATLHTEHLWWSPDFREYVWHCRRPNTLSDKFQQWASSDVIEGHILKDPGIRNCGKSNIHTYFTEDKLLRLRSGEKATQWVVTNGATANKIAEWSRGKVHIEVFAPEIQQKGS